MPERHGTSEDQKFAAKLTKQKLQLSSVNSIYYVTASLSTLKMTKLHIANTFFEWELEKDQKSHLSEGFRQHAIFRQLQFLPALYADRKEGFLISDLPEESYWNTLNQQRIFPPQAFLLNNGSFSSNIEIESWGASRLIAEFAAKHHLIYHIPDWEIVRKVNSKQFSFTFGPKLPFATLLENETQAKRWLQSFEGTKVLKTCYGVSGKGHLIADHQTSRERITRFLKDEWNKNLPVVAEPWVKRILDFSTQWSIDRDQTITYVGAALCQNNERGEYRYNTVGEEQALFHTYFPFLQEHLKIVRPVLEHIAEFRFFGNVGIDAMLYTDEAKNPYLHPIVEINARKTMGWAALQIQKQYYPHRLIKIAYAPGTEGFLPKAIMPQKGEIHPFKRNLVIYEND